MKLYDSLEQNLQEWVMKQQVFFVSSAPVSGKRVNISPKGLPSSSFSVLDPNQCAYVDGTGSGIDTIANILENGRVTIMFCSFETSPRILKMFCTGRVVEWNHPKFTEWLLRMGEKNVTAARAVIILDIFQIQTSCGFGVPKLALKQDPNDASKQIPYLQDRKTLGHWAGKMVAADEMNAFRAEYNARSLDGLPGLETARRDNGEKIWYGDLRARVQNTNRILYTVMVIITSTLVTIISMYSAGVTTLRLAV